MRIRSGQCVLGLFVVVVAYGCYSSIAPVPKIDPGGTDSELPVEQPTGPDACSPRKPWEGPGVTGLLPVSSTEALVFSGENYFTAEFDTGGTGDASDPNLGRVTAWRDTGLLSDLWSNAPAITGVKPWDDPGVTAAYIAKGGGEQVIISRFRRWVRAGNEWPAAGSVVEDWMINDAGPPLIDGQAPWEGTGVTATYFAPDGASFFVISQDKGWQRRTADPTPRNWTWLPEGGAFRLAESTQWSSAPPIDGQKPYEGKGVTAAWYLGTKFFVVSVDRMWTNDGARWTALGLLKDQPGWSSAPAGGCKR